MYWEDWNRLLVHVHCTGRWQSIQENDPYTRYGQPLALKMGRTCRVYKVIREFRVGNVLIYIKSPVKATAEAKTWKNSHLTWMNILHELIEKKPVLNEIC